MKIKSLHINPTEIKRNELHLDVQRKTRMIIYTDKTKYNRNEFKNILRKELGE